MSLETGGSQPGQPLPGDHASLQAIGFE